MKGRPADPRSPHKVCANMSGFANPTNGDLPWCQGCPLLSKIEPPGEEDEMRPSMAFSCIF